MPQSTKTMVYAPEIMVLISTKDGNVDVSDDVIQGKLTRRIDAVSDFVLTLNNRKPVPDGQGKYTGKLQRMDRIVIFMKRLHWVQVFAGYLQVVPVFDLYPNTCVISGVCSLTRLQNYYWNPLMPASQDIMYQEKYRVADGSSQIDSGIGSMIGNIMNKVGNWTPSTVHVQNMPEKWLTFAKTLQLTAETSEEQRAAHLAKVRELLGVSVAASVGLGGPGDVVGGVLNASAQSVAPSGTTFTMDQIVQQAHAVGIPGDQLAVCAAIAMAESGGKSAVKGGPNSNGSYDYGLWQINDIHKSNTWIPNNDMNSMLDPGNNAKAMFAISQGGKKWTDWTTFNKGMYLPFLGAAREAVAKFDPSKNPGTASQGPRVGGNVVPSTSVTQAANTSVNTDAAGAGVGTVQNIIQIGLAQVGITYAWGGGNINGPSKGISDGGGNADKHGDYNKVGFDCSGLLQYIIYKGTGGKITIPRTTAAMRQSRIGGLGTKVAPSEIQPGDLILSSTHVAMYVGNNMMLEAPQSGGKVQVVPDKRNRSDLHGIWRINGLVNNGQPIDLNSGGSDLGGVVLGVGTGETGNGTTGLGSAEPLAEALFRMQFMGSDDTSANVLYDDDSLILTEPLFNTVKAVCAAGMRSFMSAPNGDFVAFYPDPFGIMGKGPAIQLEDVELINLSISLNTAELASNVYTAHNEDYYSGTVDDTAWQLLYHSSVGIQNKEVMKELLNIDDVETELNPTTFYARYGARPVKVKFSDIKDSTLNYFQALYVFMQKWSDQFNSKIEMTFMPELYPGMRVEIKSKGVTFYVKEVTHEFDFATGFTTTAIVNSPTTKQGGIPGLVRG